LKKSYLVQMLNKNSSRGSAKDVTMWNWQFVVHLGPCCASFRAALGENEQMVAVAEKDSCERPKIQLWDPSTAAAPLHHLCMGPAKDVTMHNWQFMVHLRPCLPLCLSWGRHGWKWVQWHRAGQLREIKNQLWAPSNAAAPICYLCMGPAKEVTMVTPPFLYVSKSTAQGCSCCLHCTLLSVRSFNT
jgi:hypothetical protein